MSRIEGLRKQFKAAYEAAGAKLTPTPFIIKALVNALKKHPKFNASVNEVAETLVFKHYCHIGIAVDTDAGLLVPVLRDADKKSLLELAKEPGSWRSVAQIAAAQSLPAPMLEQLLLQLRRADLVEARRGRSGGYRLRRSPAAIPLATVLQAVQADPALAPTTTMAVDLALADRDPALAGEQVAQALVRRLQRALERELDVLTLEELLFDLRSWQECLSEDGGLMVG